MKPQATEPGPNSQPVGINEGRPGWALAAFEILTRVAGSYNGLITYSELADEVQRSSGLFTRSPQRNWIGKVLADVAHRCHSEQLPALSALVVHKHDGQVGDGYAEVLHIAGIDQIDDRLEREEHAAISRLECYRHWCDNVPVDAKPRLSPILEQRVSRVAPRREALRGDVCSRCFIEMPISGLCASCDA
mgnify:CR=1 FL=1